MSKSSIVFFMFLLGTLSSTTVNARTTFGEENADFLVQSCKAATEIFNARDEKRFMAAQRTSLSDALRAGYCLGALEQVECSWQASLEFSTYEAAREIAAMEYQPNQVRGVTADELLRWGACQ